jgi:glycosyltransferase involved in cell wall biosynthesis
MDTPRVVENETSSESALAGRKPRVCVSLPYAAQLVSSASKYFGGAEVRGATFLFGLARSGLFDVHVVVLGEPGAPTVRADGITVHTRPDVPVSVVSPLPNPSATVWGQVDADVYLTFGANEASAQLVHYCRAVSRPMVLSIASDAAFDESVHELSTTCDAYGVPGHYPWYAIRHAHTVLVQTERQQALYAARYGRDAVLVRNPLPTATRQPARQAPQYGGRMLWIGRLDPNKRYEEALILAAALPHRELIMVCNNILSLGENTIDELQTAMPNLMLADQVALADTDALFRFSDVLVNTSVVEGFPNTFLQAGAQGIPVVTMGVDPDGMLRQHGCGRAADGTSVGLAHEVEALLNDTEAYAAAAAANSQWAHDRHDPDARIAELITTLRTVLATHASAHAVRAA